MIALTETTSVYDLRAPAWPTIFGWWTLLCFFILLIIWWRWALMRKKSIPLPEQIAEVPLVMTKEVRLQQLLEINTSVRTPEQKAKALLQHLFIYIWREDEETEIAWYTLQEIKHIAWSELLIPFFSELYTSIYTDQKTTHSSINTITKSIHSSLSWT